MNQAHIVIEDYDNFFLERIYQSTKTFQNSKNQKQFSTLRNYAEQETKRRKICPEETKIKEIKTSSTIQTSTREPIQN